MASQGVNDPERMLMLAYVPAARREAVAAIWRLDERLEAVVRAAREPLAAQLRLRWWHDALASLATEPQRGEPLLDKLAGEGVSGNLLAPVPFGWEALLGEPPLEQEGLDAIAGRGSALFQAAAEALGAIKAADELSAGGAGWALINVARHATDVETPERALAAARCHLQGVVDWRWPRPLRPLGMLVVLAARDAKSVAGFERKGSPARLIRMLRHRLTGR